MPRPLRPLAPGDIYHVTARGNRRQPIYLDANDRVFFLKWLNRVALDDEWETICYVLMGNHFHALVCTPKPNLSHGMQRLMGVYGQFFNDMHELSGHVFEGRFKSKLIESEAHYLSCARYNDLNPVRAGLVDHPLEWRWSSYGPTIGHDIRPDFLRTDLLLAQFGSSPEGARREYVNFVESDLRAANAA